MVEWYYNGIGTAFDYTKAQKYVDMAEATYKSFEETYSRAEESFRQYELLHEHEYPLIAGTTNTRQILPEGIKLLNECNRLTAIRQEFSKACESIQVAKGAFICSTQRQRELSQRMLELLLNSGHTSHNLADNSYFKLAISQYTDAAEAGNPIAQLNLATMYYNGEGTPQNFQLAFQWHMRAAEQKNVDSQLYLFNMFFANQGVPDDFMLSDLKKLTKSSADVQFIFGKKYSLGQGVQKNSIKAYSDSRWKKQLNRINVFLKFQKIFFAQFDLTS